MESDLVTVVVPAYNAALYLKQTLESALSQTYRNFEIIVVDDGSTDDTSVIARQFGNKIRYIHQTNHGLSFARNTAIRKANGEIIALLDSDDLWTSEFLEAMTNLLGQYPEASGAYCGFENINAEGYVVGKPSLKIVAPEMFHETILAEGNWLVPSAVVFRKGLAEQVGYFDESISPVADTDLWIKLSANYSFVGLSRALIKYRRHENNMSKDPERMTTAIGQLTEKMYGSAEGDVFLWPPAKQKAYGSYYRGGAISFFAANRMQKSVDYLKKLAEVSPEYACSLTVWRGFVRAFIPDEYQFDNSVQLDWALIQTKLDELFDGLARKTDRSIAFHSLVSRMKGFAFLALADEAGREGEPARAYDWIQLAVRSHPRLLFARPFWGTVVRNISALFSSSSKLSETEAAGS